MGRAVRGAVPGVAIAIERFGGSHALGRYQPLQRRKPVAVVGLAGVGIAFRLRALDLVSQGIRPPIRGCRAMCAATAEPLRA